MSFIAAHDFPAGLVLRVLGVAESTYYDRRARQVTPSRRELDDAVLLEQICKIRTAHEFAATYGSPRVWLELRRQGVRFARHHLVLTALNHALRSRDVRSGQLIFHSDNGAQYTALRFTQRLLDAGVAPRPATPGTASTTRWPRTSGPRSRSSSCTGPAPRSPPRTQAEHAVVRYIDGWYNPRRNQAGLGGLSPDEYEDQYHRQQQDPDR